MLPGLEPTIYSTRVEHSNYYTTRYIRCRTDIVQHVVITPFIGEGIRVDTSPQITETVSIEYNWPMAKFKFINFVYGIYWMPRKRRINFLYDPLHEVSRSLTMYPKYYNISEHMDDTNTKQGKAKSQLQLTPWGKIK